MAQPIKKDAELPMPFRQLLAKAEVPIVHLQPKQTSSIAAAITSDTADTLRGLALAYGVLPRDIIRACIVIGLEELTWWVDELGHATQTPPN